MFTEFGRLITFKGGFLRTFEDEDGINVELEETTETVVERP